MASSNHSERVRRGEVRASWVQRYGFLSGIDVIRVDIFNSRMVPHSNHSILALNIDADILWKYLGKDSRDPNPKVNVHTIFDFLGSSGCYLVSYVLSRKVGRVVIKYVFSLFQKTEFYTTFGLYMISEGESFNDAFRVWTFRVHFIDTVHIHTRYMN
jgi:hypothetical protein